MLEIQPAIVASLREMARRGVPASQMLREVLATAELTEPRSVWLSWYLMDAFGLELHQTNAVFGWAEVGTGELDDAKVDYFLGRHIREAAPRWKTFETATPQ